MPTPPPIRPLRPARHLTRRRRLGLVALITTALLLLSGGAYAVNQDSDRPSNRPGQVVIKRDSHGVPHVYAKDTRGLFFGFGYAVAEDRLYQLEMAKRSGNGTVAEVLGPDYLATDIATRSNIDPASIRAQIADLPAEDKAMFEGYAAGVNERIREVNADPDHLMPKEFADAGFQPAAWTTEDVALVWVGLILNRFFSNSSEVANLELLQQLKAAHGDEVGLTMYEQLRWLEDPTAPTIVPRDQATGAPAPGRHDRGTRGPVSGQAAEDFQKSQTALTGLTTPDMPTASNAWVLSPRRTADRIAILHNGPQQGFNNPSFVHGIGLHGAGYDVTGHTPVGLLPVLFGTNGTIAWGSTVGSLDTNDVYTEVLNPRNQHEYLFNGQYRPMTKRTDTIAVRGAAPTTVDIYSTTHGFVQSWDGANNRAYTKRASWHGHEIATMLGWANAAKAKNWNQYLAQGSQVSASITWFYADVRGNIGAVGLGRLPQRPAAQDIQFPALGDGTMEWQGTVPFAQNPRSYNPPQGYLASWNNQIAGGLRADGANFSRVDRVNEIHPYLDGTGRLDADQIWQIAEDSAMADLNARYFVPMIVEATADLPADDPNRQAADLLAEWDLKNRSSNGSTYDSPGTTVLRAWLASTAQRVLADDLPAPVYARYQNLGYPTLTAQGSPGSVQPAAASKVLWNSLSGDQSGVPQRYDFLNGADPDQVVLAGLTDAVQQLQAEHGPDMATWTTPVVNHRFSRYNAIGVPWAAEQFDVPDYRNVGTLNVQYELRRGDVAKCSVAAPGQSGFIDPAGARSPHYSDQLSLFEQFECKQDPMTTRQVDAERESIRVLTPGREHGN